MASILILLPLVVFLGLFILLIGSEIDSMRERTWIGNFLLAAVFWGVLAIASAEMLTLFRSINRFWLSAAWILVLLPILFVGWRTGAFRRAFDHIKGIDISFSKFEWVIVGSFGLIISVLFLIAVTSPPNNVDSFLYHMSRVMHWAQNGSLEHYQAYREHQLNRPILAETVILHLRVLWGNDRPVNLVQWFSMVGSLIGVAGIAKLLGAGKKGQLLASSFAISLPIGILEATSTQNDYVTAFMAVSMAYLVVQGARRSLSRVELLGVPITMGLGILTKGVFFVYSPALVLWFAYLYMRDKGFVRAALFGLISFAIVVTLNAGYWSRNIRAFGGPYGRSEWLQRAIGFDVKLFNNLFQSKPEDDVSGEFDQLRAASQELWCNNSSREDDCETDTIRGIASSGLSLIWPGSRRIINKPEVYQIIGEAGIIEGGVTESQLSVQLKHEFYEPIVLVQPVSYNETDPAIARIKHVEPDNFTVFLQEPSGEDGNHENEVVSYLVLERGQWNLPDGSRLIVQNIDTNSTIGRGIQNKWHSVLFALPFPNKPVVIAQLQTFHDGSWASVRIRDIQQTGFDIAIEGEEKASARHGSETVGYIVFEESGGYWQDVQFDAGLTGQAFGGDPSRLRFTTPFPDSPVFIANLASRIGLDPVTLRYQNLGRTGVDLLLSRERDTEGETAISSERIAYIAIEGSGPVYATKNRAPVEFPRYLRDLAQTLGRNFTSPSGFVTKGLVNFTDALPGIFGPDYSGELEASAWNHEDHAGNLHHLIVIIISVPILFVVSISKRDAIALTYGVAVIFGYMFSPIVMNGATGFFAIRYQLPFFILYAPLIGHLSIFIDKGWISNAFCAGFVIASFPWVILNSTRPIIGMPPWPTKINSIFAVPQRDILFANNIALSDDYYLTAEAISESDCKQIGLLVDQSFLEYPLWYFLEAPQSDVEIHTILADIDQTPGIEEVDDICAVVCTNCDQKVSVDNLTSRQRFDSLTLFTSE